MLDSGSVMARLLHSASGRLGFWDSMPRSDDFRSQLERLLESHAHAVIEGDSSDFAETPTPELAAIAAVCDKIVARGNPTLVDPDFEERLLSTKGAEFFQSTALADEDDVGVRFQGSRLPQGSSNELSNAAQDLRTCPIAMKTPCPAKHCQLTCRSCAASKRSGSTTASSPTLDPGLRASSSANR